MAIGVPGQHLELAVLHVEEDLRPELVLAITLLLPMEELLVLAVQLNLRPVTPKSAQLLEVYLPC